MIHSKTLATPSTPKKRRSSLKKDFRQTVFENIHYLGCSKIDDPSNEAEMLRLMRFLDEQRTSATVTVSLAVPHSARGIVVCVVIFL
ncbi:unnamed protein product [Cylicostephanus goldi]|uniref:Uncharacterized protein n=1 Tax=Cylicostephanus goldi TaxID=71465 RepID=A0A3P6S250_CYLGO|nr:unnamed protein product [Cylicostephanus goldi]